MLRSVLVELFGSVKKSLSGVPCPVRNELKFRMSDSPGCLREFGAQPLVDFECLIPGSQQAFLLITARNVGFRVVL